MEAKSGKMLSFSDRVFLSSPSKQLMYISLATTEEEHFFCFLLISAILIATRYKHENLWP